MRIRPMIPGRKASFGFFEAVSENKTFMMNAYHSISRDQVEKNICIVLTYDLMIKVIDDKAKDMQVREEDKKFIADFYKCSFVGVLLEWIENGMKQDPHVIVDKMGLVMHDNITRALEAFRTDVFHKKNRELTDTLKKQCVLFFRPVIPSKQGK